MADPDNARRQWDIARDLRTWIQRGGFPPRITGFVEFDKLVALATCEEIIKRH